MPIAIEGSGRPLAETYDWARGARDRMRGLLGREPLHPGEALILDRSTQVHTFGMRYPIDVVFCDREWNVLHVVRAMRPRRLTRVVWRARYTIELPAGSVPEDLVGRRLTVAS